ncbi:MAG: hypothetical protein M9924_06015 [Rhizobiaceae bacterium]|nr:hypothetical protein [Rhizobiaceae bacterium]
MAEQRSVDSAPAPARYLLLLCVQTAAATALFWATFPVFQAILSDTGRPQMLSSPTILISLVSALVIQAAYWLRYSRVRVWVPFHNALIGHLVLFASRASFFFGAALFSAVVFRHLPRIEMLPPVWIGTAKGLGFLAVLFSLFCYALELERLGRAIEPS